MALIAEFNATLDALLDKTEADARTVYGPRPARDWMDRLKGSLAGIAACRGKTIDELKILLSTSHLSRLDARQHDDAQFWWYRSYEEQVSWICNVMSCWLIDHGTTPITAKTTVRGFLELRALAVMTNARRPTNG